MLLVTREIVGNQLKEHKAQYDSNVDRLAEAKFESRVMMLEGRRNHGCAFVGKRLVEILGRWAESVEETMGPSRRLRKCHEGCDLNHVVAVPFKNDIWIPCGFEGHRVGNETSTTYARIVNSKSLEVQRGPDLAMPGGACAALAVDDKICQFGGTDGSHDDGRFLRGVRCYDGKQWSEPFDDLPFGLDHANAVVIEKDTCHKGDPERILLMNFRSEHFANMRTEIFVAELSNDKGKKIPWRLFSNDTSSLPRDASGVAVVARGRYVVQFGGVFYAYGDSVEAVMDAEKQARQLGAMVGAVTSGPLRARRRGWHVRVDFAEIRALDVCGDKNWLHVGRLRTSRFATQSCRSNDVVATCGGRPGGKATALRHGDDAATGYDHQNIRDCELHRVKHLEVMVQSALHRAARRRDRFGGDTTTPASAHVSSLLTKRQSLVESRSRDGRRGLTTPPPPDYNIASPPIQDASQRLLANYGRRPVPKIAPS